MLNLIGEENSSRHRAIGEAGNAALRAATDWLVDISNKGDMGEA